MRPSLLCKRRTQTSNFEQPDLPTDLDSLRTAHVEVVDGLSPAVRAHLACRWCLALSYCALSMQWLVVCGVARRLREHRGFETYDGSLWRERSRQRHLRKLVLLLALCHQISSGWKRFYFSHLSKGRSYKYGNIAWAESLWERIVPCNGARSWAPSFRSTSISLRSELYQAISCTWDPRPWKIPSTHQFPSVVVEIVLVVYFALDVRGSYGKNRLSWPYKLQRAHLVQTKRWWWEGRRSFSSPPVAALPQHRERCWILDHHCDMVYQSNRVKLFD